MVARLKGIYSADTISSSIFFSRDTQAPILDIIYHERNLQWLLLLLVSCCIAQTQFYLTMIRWSVGQE